MKNTMKKSFLLSFSGAVCASLLALSLTGCPESGGSAPPPVTPQPGGDTNSTDDGEVLPMHPEGGSPVPTATETPTASEGARLAPAETIGKIAAETVMFPPAEDLCGQIDEYVTKMGKELDDLDGTTKYKDDADFIVRDCNALALVALSVGMSEDDSPYKKAAPAIIKAALALADAADYASAKKAYAELQESLKSTAGGELGWTKIGKLGPLMKAVPNLSSSLTRLTNTEKKLKTQVEKQPKRLFGSLATMAALMQGSIANAEDTEKPDMKAEWKKECESFRDAALKANVAAHGFAEGTVDYKTYWETFKAMTDSCDKCHQTFYPSAVGKSE